MKKLQTYVLKDVTSALVPAFATLVLIMMVGFCMQLLHEGLDVVRLHRLLPPLFAYCVPMVLPSAFLTAVVMTFGRLSADNELIALRAGGVHLFRVIHPVLLVAVGLTLLVTVFQFELVPRARASIKKLKYRALKQILLDRVILSSRRQFSFESVVIQYDDFVNGRLTNPILLEKSGARPEMIMRAAYATVRTDQAEPETVTFEMEDCVITHFGGQTYSEAITTRSKSGIFSLSLAPESSEEIATDEKHLPTAQLVGRLEQLRRETAGRPKLERPEQYLKKQKKKLSLKKAEINDLQDTLEGLRDRYQRYAVQERRRQEEEIERCRRRIEEAQKQAELIQTQLLDCVASINEARDPGGEHTDYDRIVELEKQRKSLQQQQEARREEIQQLRTAAEEARIALSDAQSHAARVREQIEVLEQQEAKLAAERKELRQRVRQAEEQEDLLSVRLRIHKRLAQAVSLLVFALLGIPLGVMAGGRSTMIAFGISFAIVLAVFYPFLIFGQVAAEAGALPVGPAMWTGNGFVGAIALFLMLKVLFR
ncbi:MAG: LptF/LptG family permease [Candidatus Brocadiia bacterium]